MKKPPEGTSEPTAKAPQIAVAVVAILVAVFVVNHFHQRKQLARLNNEATALIDQGQFAPARDNLELARSKDPENHIIWKNLGVAYEGLNDIPRAIEAFERSLQINPNQPEIHQLVETLRARLDEAAKK